MLYVISLFAVFAANIVQSQINLSTCAQTNRVPCKYSYTYDYFNGSVDTGIVENGCNCPNGKSCYPGWRRPNYMIKVRVFSDVANLTAKFMFCERFNLTTCTPGSTALEMSGMPYPRSIVSFNCKCSDSNPLFYKTSSFGANFQYHFSYICDSHKVTCEGLNSICFTSNETTTYTCECPSGFACRLAPNTVSPGRCTAI